jgi:hypothetical protein
MKYCVTMVAVLLASPALAQDFSSFDRRLSALEEDVAAIKAKLGMPLPVIREMPREPGAITIAETGPATLTGSPTTLNFHSATGKRGYDEAYLLAMATNKPLVVWNGNAICEVCIHDTEGEFVNYVGTVPGLTPANTVTVCVPENNQMLRADVITSWTTGDATYGHVPSVRRALANWRQRRLARTTGVQADYQSAMMSYQPMMMQAPMMMGMASGGCASCGTSSGRGFFRR